MRLRVLVAVLGVLFLLFSILYCFYEVMPMMD